MSGATILIRGSLLGRFIYRISSRKLLTYKEESKDYVIPQKYLATTAASSVDLEKVSKSPGSSSENQYILVDWDGEDDPENPNNWPLWIKSFIGFFLSTLAAFVYMASATYLPAIADLQEDFEIGHVVATLPLSIFVMSYGFGPLIFSPLSEHPKVGRNSIYVVTLIIFSILQIPTALAKNIGSLLVLRILSGLFASPVLANGAASFADLFSLPYMPVGLALWGIGSYSGFTLGPLIGSGLEVATNGWRWSIWFLLIVGGALAFAFATVVPETYHQTILSRKAERLRRLTGNPNIVLESELYPSEKTKKEILKEHFLRPVEIGIFEPIVLMINIYIAMLYAIVYLWFESFPIYFTEAKKFTVVETGLTYISIIVGVIIGALFYIYMIYQDFTKPLLKKEIVHPEVFMKTAIIGSIILPIGILIFGWTATKDHHWFGAIVGATLYGVAGIIMFQTLLNYVAMSFHRYVASAFASSAFMRSTLAGAFPLFGRAMFKNLSTDNFPVAWGSTILGIITLAMIAVPVLFHLNGPKLRAKSRYAGSGDVRGL